MTVAIVEAREAGDALSSISYKLLDARIVDDRGFSVLNRLANDTQRLRKATAWPILIEMEDALTFSPTRDKNGRAVVPSIAANCRVEQGGSRGTPPFASFDIALTVDYADGTPAARWHLDLANAKDDGMQAGPLFHIQYGGHQRGHRELDHPLKVPRWCHPPMEVALLCEVVAANFFTEQWEEMRDEPGWCRAIALYQKLCYSHYLKRMQEHLTKSATTALNGMWAGEWA